MNRHLIHIVLNGIRTFIIPATIFLVSWLIVNQYSKELWGEFVVDLLLVNLLAHVLQWGNKDHLVRLFSKEPLKINFSFYQNLYTRSLLLIPVLLILLLASGSIYKAGLLFLWVLGLFIYQSSDSLVVYSKKFAIQVLAELLSFILIIVYLFTKEQIVVTDMVLIFMIAVWLKVAVIAFKLFPPITSFTINIKELAITIPFLMIGFSGLLQSRVDQYIIALYAAKDVVAMYQIFLSAFILIQALSAIVVIPYNKYLYRVKIEVFNKLQQKIMWFGLAVVIIAGMIFTFILKYFYQINISNLYYLMGGLFVFPAFVYVPVIYLFYRVRREKEIMMVNYLGAAFNLILTLLFVFYSNPFNAIIASAIAQWLMLGWYIYRKKKIIDEIEMS